MKTINITVEVGGDIEIHAEGFKGAQCETEVNRLLDGLGFDRGRGERTAEFYIQPQPKVKIKQEL
jgi:hypothetical protein